MDSITVCQQCKNLIVKTAGPCRFCGHVHSKSKNFGSAFVIFIVVLMLVVLAITIFGSRRLQLPDQNNNHASVFTPLNRINSVQSEIDG